MKTQITTLLGLLLMAGQSTATEEAAENEADAAAATCIITRRIHTIRTLDERHVIAEVRGGKRYVLGVEERCRGLENAVDFAVESSTSRICPDRFSELIFTEKSRRSQYCAIESVELLSEADAEGSEAESASHLATEPLDLAVMPAAEQDQ